MLVCHKCGNTVQLDTDSFETNIEQNLDVPDDQKAFEMSATVVGYCEACQTEHRYSIQGYADVDCR